MIVVERVVVNCYFLREVLSEWFQNWFFIPSLKLISKQLNSTLSEIALAYSNQMTNQNNCYITKIESNVGKIAYFHKGNILLIFQLKLVKFNS